MLLLYSSFSHLLQNEKTRVYYDDVNYIYRNEYIKKTLENVNLKQVVSNLNNNENDYFITIGIESDELFNNFLNYKNFINKMLNAFEVKEMHIIKTNKVDDLKKCIKECQNDNCSSNCNDFDLKVSEDMKSYINTLNIDIDCQDILVTEFRTCQTNNSSWRNYFSWVSV